MGWIEDLHATLDQRAMPEDIARIITSREGLPYSDVRAELRRVADSRPPRGPSLMSGDFERPDDCAPQLAAAARLLGVPERGISPSDPAQIRGYIERAGQTLGGWLPCSDWKADRLNREQRRQLAAILAEKGAEMPALASRRQYNRQVRALRRLEGKCRRMERAQRMRRLVLIGRSGFAGDIPLDRFRADPAAAAFVAYWTARKNRRREFTLDGRDNPFDRACDALLKYLRLSPVTDWGMVAMVYPQPEILARLSDTQRGMLMGRWFTVMGDTAEELRDAWPGSADRAQMIVRKGMDSSTWNTMAQAYNAARAGWLNCVTAAGAGALLEPCLPGKVMRLMAADLAYWHRACGRGADPDTRVWAALPMPWDVMDGTLQCARAHVEAACRAAGVDPAASGWAAPRAAGAVAEFKPTPELVHGVTVADPVWAALLRRAGVFSGKRLRPEMAGEVAMMPPGMVTGALPGKLLGSP
jgi:hypothetical protein